MKKSTVEKIILICLIIDIIINIVIIIIVANTPNYSLSYFLSVGNYCYYYSFYFKGIVYIILFIKFIINKLFYRGIKKTRNAIITILFHISIIFTIIVNIILFFWALSHSV